MFRMENPRLSRFTKFIPLGENTAVYHTINMAVLFLENEMAKRLQQGEIPLLESDSTRRLAEKMAEEKMLVEAGYDDLVDYRKIQDQLSDLPVSILYLLLTEKCNFACRYCFVEGGFPVEYKRTSMSCETARAGIDLYSRTICRRPSKRSRIIFYGGEPLLNFTTMVYAVKYAKQLKRQGRLPDNTRLSLNTNASAITPEIAQFLAEHDIVVSVSIDGRKEIHDKERIFPSGEGTFDATLLGFKLLQKYGANLGVSCTITESGVDYLKESLGFFVEELGIHSLGLNILRGCDSTTLIDPGGYFGKVSQALIDAFRLLREKGVYEDRMMRKVRFFVERRPYPNDCAACGGEIAVSPDGQVGVCHGAIGRKDYFIPLTSNLDPLIHPYWTEWRTRSPFNMPECTDCIALGICGGGCPYEAFLKEGTIWGLDRRFCVHAKATLEFLIQDLWEQMKAKTE